MKKIVAQNGGLKFVGQRGPDGRPTEYMNGFPARDIAADEMSHFTQEQIEAMIASNLYVFGNGDKPASNAFAGPMMDEEMNDGN